MNDYKKHDDLKRETGDNLNDLTSKLTAFRSYLDSSRAQTLKTYEDGMQALKGHEDYERDFRAREEKERIKARQQMEKMKSLIFRLD